MVAIVLLLCIIIAISFAVSCFLANFAPMIISYSATGNTKLVAQGVAECLNDYVEFISSDNDHCSIDLADGEPIGIFFPVHGWNVPRPVTEWIEHACFNNIYDHYVYAVATCGDEVGKAMECLDAMLKTHWQRCLDSCYDVVMPNTYVTLPYMDTDTTEVAAAKIKAAAERIKVIADGVRARARGCFVEHPGTMPWVLTHIIGAAFHKWLVNDRYFKVDVQRCISCGQCAAACNRGNISGGKGCMPTWLHVHHACTTCLACYHHCPQHAISFGPLTHKRGQYVAPASLVTE